MERHQINFLTSSSLNIINYTVSTEGFHVRSAILKTKHWRLCLPLDLQCGGCLRDGGQLKLHDRI